MEHHQVVIVGGGNAGISLAARLIRGGAPDVAVVESESVHRYRPLLSYVGAGPRRRCPSSTWSRRGVRRGSWTATRSR